MLITTRQDIMKLAGLDASEIEQVEAFIEEGDLGFIESESFEKLFNFFCDTGEIPYGIAKAKDGMPDVWILEYLADMSASAHAG